MIVLVLVPVPVPVPVLLLLVVLLRFVSMDRMRPSRNGVQKTDSLACKSGTSFLLHGPHSRCLAHSTVSCPAGTESKEGNAFEDTFCDDCEGGTFSLGGGAACGPHGSTNCGPGDERSTIMPSNTVKCC